MTMSLADLTDPRATRLDTPPWYTPGFLVRRAQRIHTAKWNELFGTEVTGPQYAVLLAIALWPDSDQQTVGELSGHDKATITGIVERLVRAGLVARESDPANHRRVILSLTPAAERRMPTYAGLGMRVHDALFSLLPAGTAGEFVSLLREVVLSRRSLPEPDRPDPGFPVMTPRTSIGHLLRRTHQIHVELWSEVFDDTLTIPQYCVLVTGLALDSPSQQTVADLSGLNPSSAAAVIARLEEQGWLVRTEDPSDGRRRVLGFTHAARVAARWCRHGADAVQADLFGALGSERTERLAELLDALVSRHEAEHR